MKNYEAIKDMSIDEMSVVIYMMVKPMIEAFGFDDEKTVKETMQQHIKAFLNAEVKAK